ncbi:MAG: hypothetical protein WEB79_04245 [Thermoleophilaceae bacterium]
MRSRRLSLDIRPLLVLAAALVLAVGATACGGSDDGGGGEGASEQERARATVERLYDAMAEMDADAVCAQLSDAAQEQIAQGGLGSKGETCAEGFEGFFQAAEDAGGLEAPLNAEVRKVDVDGNRASATVQFGPGRRGQVPLVKVDGEWKLEAAGAAPSGS